MSLSFNLGVFRCRLQQLLDSRGVAPTRLCTDLGMSSGTISRYLSGTRTPDLKRVIEFSKYFDVSVDWLLGIDCDTDTSFSEDVKEIATLYSVASPDDQRVVHAVLDRYKQIVITSGAKYDVH